MRFTYEMSEARRRGGKRRAMTEPLNKPKRAGRGSFKIMEDDGPRTVKGHIVGKGRLWGLHSWGTGATKDWVLTHLPTGLGMMHDIRDLATAKKVVKIVEEMPVNWNTWDAAALSKEVTDQGLQYELMSIARSVR